MDSTGNAPVAGAAPMPNAGAAPMPNAGAAPNAGATPNAAGTPDMGTVMPMGGQMVPMLAGDELPDPRGGCDIDTGFPGDEACMLPPAPGEGMQIHIGPEDYNNPGAHRFPPGSETSECVNFTTPNTEDIHYQGWVLSGRPGTHHIINTMYATPNAGGGTSFAACRDPGTGTAAGIIDNLPGASKAYMPRAKIAPENMNLGRLIPANTASQADMHYFNITEDDVLREFWLNIYFVDKDQVTEQATAIRAMGGLSWTVLPIAPGTDNVYKYECPITSPGRIIQLLGHYHAHGVRFTSHLRKAGGERTKVFEMYDYLEPQIFYYNSIEANPEFSDAMPGATSGQIDVVPGDVLEWECHIINDSQTGLRYSNFVETGEMCNLWGAAVGPDINCVIP